MNYERVSGLTTEQKNNLYKFLFSIIFQMFDPNGDSELRFQRTTPSYKTFCDVYIQSMNIIVRNGNETIEGIKSNPIFLKMVNTVNTFLDNRFEQVDPGVLLDNLQDSANLSIADHIEVIASAFEEGMVNEFYNIQLSSQQ